MKRLLAFVGICLLSLLAAEGLRHIRFLQATEELLWDLRIRFFSPATRVHPDIVLIALDEDTMRSLPYRSPIPRDFLRDLHTHIAVANPRLIAYDLFFKDPSFPDADKRFADALHSHPPYAVSLGRDTPGGMVTEDPPLELFHREMAGVGLADLPLNPFSQVVRQAKSSYQTPNGDRPTFVGMLYTAITHKGVVPSSFLFPIADCAGAMTIRYALPEKTNDGRPTFPTYPAHLVATGAIPTEWLADKIVIVGATFTDAQDFFLTPFYSSTYGYRRVSGLEIHAQILSSLLMGQYLGHFSPLQERVLTAVLILIVTVLSLRARAWRLFASAPACIVVILLMSIWAMRAGGILVPVAVPTTSVLFTYGVLLCWGTLSEGRQRRWLKSAFSKYVAASVVDELVRHPERVRLGGELRLVTCLFSDIANFTTMSERLGPEQVVQFLNAYLGGLGKVILDHRGTIDKYVGDSIVAIFGAPLPMDGHAELAVRAAIAMQRENDQLNARWQSVMGQPIVTRIGVHTGKAIVGNIGSEVRFDYTAIGDTVNTASRLEGVNKQFGTRVLISDSTKQLLSEGVRVRSLGGAVLKGKENAMPVYEALIDAV